MKRLASYCLLSSFVVVCLAIPVKADLIPLGPSVGGGGTEYILDTQTGLKWLSLDGPQQSMSYNQLLTALSPGGLLYGFQLATDAQTQGLFQDAFGVTSFGGVSEVYWNEVSNFQKLLGATDETGAGGLEGTYLWSGGATSTDGATLNTLQPGGPPNQPVWSGYYVGFETGGSNWLLLKEENPDIGDPEVSYWLVQTTPEPATILLVSSALIGLAALRKRFKQA